MTEPALPQQLPKSVPKMLAETMVSTTFLWTHEGFTSTSNRSIHPWFISSGRCRIRLPHLFGTPSPLLGLLFGTPPFYLDLSFGTKSYVSPYNIDYTLSRESSKQSWIFFSVSPLITACTI